MPSALIVTSIVVGVAGHRLVDRVVDDLPDEVVQAARVGRADVHARPAADRLEALEDLDARGGVVAAGSARRDALRGASPLRAVAAARSCASASLGHAGPSDQALVEPPSSSSL